MPKRRPKIRIRVTGYTFFVILTFVLLAAWNTGINLFYIVVGALLSVIVISAVFTRRNLKHLEITRNAPFSVEREQEFSASVRVENRRRLFPAMSLRLEERGANRRTLGYALRIPRNHSATMRFRMAFPKRGVYRLSNMDLVSTFPFGLMEGRLPIRDDVEVLVHPRVIAIRTGWSDQISGSGDTARPSDIEGDEFFCLREYVPGDDIRRIAWRVSARAGSLVVRELEPDLSRFVVFLVDTYDVPEVEGFEDHFEQALEIVASLAVTLLNRGYAVSAITPEAGVPLGEGRGHGMKILDMLARVQPCETERKPPQRWPTYNEPRKAAYVLVSPNPAEWGRKGAGNRVATLDPREVIRA